MAHLELKVEGRAGKRFKDLGFTLPSFVKEFAGSLGDNVSEFSIKDETARTGVFVFTNKSDLKFAKKLLKEIKEGDAEVTRLNLEEKKRKIKEII